MNLQLLNVKNNRIQMINNNTFVGLNQLLKLYLTSNLIQSIDDESFQPLNNLRILSLANNAIKIIQANFFKYNIILFSNFCRFS